MKELIEEIKNEDTIELEKLNSEIQELEESKVCIEVEIKKLEQYIETGEGKVKFIRYIDVNEFRENEIGNKSQAKETIKNMKILAENINQSLSVKEDRASELWQEIYRIVTLNDYEKNKLRIEIKKRFAEINRQNLNETKELLDNTDIINSDVLREFLTKIIELVIKKSIEKREIYRFLWESDAHDLPKSEKKIQPIIKSHLQSILEIKGIQISREIVAANGALDYHCSYNFNKHLNKVCIELKLAHSEQLLDGLSKQLPEYMDDEGTKDGIFIVLWFKSKNFDKPSKYQNKDQMLIELKNSIPNNLRIDIIIIDCSKPIVPSKL